MAGGRVPSDGRGRRGAAARARVAGVDRRVHGRRPLQQHRLVRPAPACTVALRWLTCEGGGAALAAPAALRPCCPPPPAGLQVGCAHAAAHCTRGPLGPPCSTQAGMLLCGGGAAGRQRCGHIGWGGQPRGVLPRLPGAGQLQLQCVELLRQCRRLQVGVGGGEGEEAGAPQASGCLGTASMVPRCECPGSAAAQAPALAQRGPPRPALLPCQCRLPCPSRRCGTHRYSDLEHNIDLRQGQCELRYNYLAAQVGWPPGLISKVGGCMRGCCTTLLRARIRALGLAWPGWQEAGWAACASFI